MKNATLEIIGNEQWGYSCNTFKIGFLIEDQALPFAKPLEDLSSHRGENETAHLIVVVGPNIGEYILCLLRDRVRIDLVVEVEHVVVCANILEHVFS